MAYRAWIEAKVSYPAVHCWPDAPDPVRYLRQLHRHLFVIRARASVSHLDREIEFILLGEEISLQLAAWFPAANMGATSCEQLAVRLAERFSLDACSVHEDDENGAIVEVDR